MLQCACSSLVTSAHITAATSVTNWDISPLVIITQSGSQKLLASIKKQEAKATGFHFDNYYSMYGRVFCLSRSHINAVLLSRIPQELLMVQCTKLFWSKVSLQCCPTRRLSQIFEKMEEILEIYILKNPSDYRKTFTHYFHSSHTSMTRLSYQNKCAM